MARARQIKPTFFMHEVVASLSHFTRLYWIGLWTLADREGRLEYRPLRIKAQLFPYEDADIERSTSELESKGFVQRRKFSDGRTILYIVNWSKHQKPHQNEARSEFPPLDEGLEPLGEALASLDDALALEPRTLNLEPRTLNTESPLPSEGDHERVDPKADSPGGDPPDVPLQVVESWNTITSGKLPKAKLTTKRRDLIRTRVKEDGWLDDFKAACAYVVKSAFHLGQNDRGWVATLDYLLQAGKATELAEKSTAPIPQGAPNGRTHHRTATDQAFLRDLAERDARRAAEQRQPQPLLEADDELQTMFLPH